MLRQVSLFNREQRRYHAWTEQCMREELFFIMMLSLLFICDEFTMPILMSLLAMYTSLYVFISFRTRMCAVLVKLVNYKYVYILGLCTCTCMLC